MTLPRRYAFRYVKVTVVSASKHGKFGFSDIHAEAIGRGSAVLGAGRERVSDPVDHAVGVVLRVQPGDAVRAGDPLMTLHHRDGHGLEQARALCLDAVTITDARVEPRPDILGEVR